MQLACATLQRAGTTRNFLDGDIWSFVDWGANVLASFGSVDIGIASADGSSIRLSTVDISGLNMAPKSGYVFVTNFTSPGHFIDVGLFEWYTHAPANVTNPWTRIYTAASWSRQPMASWLLSRSTTLTWSPVIAAPTSSGDIEAMLVYGGLMRPSPRCAQQCIAIGAHGTSLAQYFSSLGASNNVLFMMVDTATSTFIAGSFADGPTGNVINGTTIMLPKLNDVQNSLIAPILSASTTTVGGDMISGAQAFLTCDMPCAFVYWPHNGVLNGNSEVAQVNGRLGAISNSFVVIRVGEAGHHPTGSAFQPRLIVVLPADDVIGKFVESVVRSIIYSNIGVAVLCVVLTSTLVVVIFRDLTNVEKHLSTFAEQFASSPPSNVSHDLQERHTSWITEFDHLHQAIRKLARELSTLRAFSSSALLTAANSNDDGELQGASSPDAPRLDHFSPYQMQKGRLWSVPVTTVYVRIHEDFLGGPRGDPVQVYQRHGSVFSVLHKHMSKFRGGTIACIYGDRIVMHFNAMDRTKHHSLAALAFINDCQTEIELSNNHIELNNKIGSPPHHACGLSESRGKHQRATKPPSIIMFGVASSLGHCGFLGPSQLKTFTVISTSLAQAGFMCRIAASHECGVVATWRVVELATQQSHMSFVSIARAVLPGEPEGGQTSVYEAMFVKRH